MRPAGDSWRAFLGWCVAGVGGCFGILSLLSVGPFVLLGTFILCGWLLWRFNFGWAMGGLLTGAAVPVLFVAWLNRDGPGEVCTSTTHTQTCTDEWSPWPFLATALVLTTGGLLVFARGRRG